MPENIYYKGEFQQLDLINSGPEADVFLVERAEDKKKYEKSKNELCGDQFQNLNYS